MLLIRKFLAMKEKNFKTWPFLVKFVLLSQLVYCIKYLKFEAEATQSELYHRMSNIEVQNRLHAKEISLLKVEKVEHKKEILQLRERVALLESSAFSNSTSEEKFQKRSKRPVRLLSFLPP